MKSNSTFTSDVLFTEDDVVLSSDFMECMWYANAVKNSVPGIFISTLQGVGGGNLIENYPDSFVVSRVPVVQSTSYAFNSTTWEYIKESAFKSLDYSERDWPLYLGLLFFYSPNGTALKIVSPTISRVWHIGGNDLPSASESPTYKPVTIPPWKEAQEKRYLNSKKANLLPGTRDMYGRLCHPCELQSKMYQFSSGTYECHCLCPTSNLKKYWNWQVAGFVQSNPSMNCSLISHLMGMVVCLFIGLVMFGLLMGTR